MAESISYGGVAPFLCNRKGRGGRREILQLVLIINR